MTYKNRFIPLTGIAAAIALGGPLSANQPYSQGTQPKNEARDAQKSTRKADKSDYANLRPMPTSDILGMNIDTVGNEKVGEVDEIYIDSNTGEILAMVVSTGGFLGLGEQQSLISPEDLNFNADRTLLQTDITKDQIQTAPRFNRDEQANFDRVRPMGKARANWDARNERAETRTASGLGQKANMRATGAEPRNERSTAAMGNQSHMRGMAVSDLMGMSVENRQGEAVGEVDEIFIDLRNRKLVGVVVSTGGFLGMGDRRTLFGFQELSFDAQSEKIVLDYNREQIRGLTHYDADDQSIFEDLGERIEQLGAKTGNYLSGDRNQAESRNVVSSAEMTVFDQGNSSEEIDMTAAIRTAIRKDNKLSNRANNVTIITNKGKVVLRGEVDSTSEKTAIEGIAKNQAGNRNVTSELVVNAR